MSNNPYVSPVGPTGSAPSKGDDSLDFHSVAPLYNVAGWLKLLGILNIIGGVIYCLTIIGAVIGWLPLWIGISLNNASNSLRRGYEQRRAGGVRQGMEQLALAIKIFGILALIAIMRGKFRGPVSASTFPCAPIRRR